MAGIPKKKRPTEAAPASRNRARTRLRERAAARAASLLRRPELAAIRRSTEERGIESWMVGGAVRDLILGRVVLDVDVAVFGDPLLIAQELEEKGLGTAVLISEAEPRVARVAGRRDVDLARIDGASIEEDLARRDFKVNAVAISLSTRSWIDPFGGIGDLAASRLELVSEDNLLEDPLRALRGARLIATHGLLPGRRTTAACRRVARLLPTAAPERIRAELVKLLAAESAGPALRWAARIGLLGAAIGAKLSPTASLRLLRRARVDDPVLRRHDADGRVRLRLAGLAIARGMDAEEAAGWLVSRRFSRSEAGRVSRLLRLAKEAREARGETVRWEWVRDAGPLWEEALCAARLAGAPAAARRALAHRARNARRPPRIDGRDLLRWLEIPPGPRVGELLRGVEAAGLRGTVRSPAGARKWLLAAVSSSQRPSGDTPPGRGKL